MPTILLEYDKKALQKIKDYKHPVEHWYNAVFDVADGAINAGMNAIDKVPGLSKVINSATKGIVKLIQTTAFYTVRQSAIYSEFYSTLNITIKNNEEIHKISLEDIDKVASGLTVKYLGLAASEGAVAASPAAIPGPGTAAELAAIAADIPTFLGLCIRAIGEYATYYGYDITTQEEQLFALYVLSYTSSGSTKAEFAAKQAALKNAIDIARKAAKKVAWKQLNQSELVKVIQQVAKYLGVRLTKSKLASLLPWAGIVINAGFNTNYMSSVCDAAYYLYRERHLADFYNDSELIID